MLSVWLVEWPMAGGSGRRDSDYGGSLEFDRLEPAWVYPGQQPPGRKHRFYRPPIVTGGRLIAVTTDGVIVTRSQYTGEGNEYPLGQRVLASPVSDGKYLYLVTEGGAMSVFAVPTRELLQTVLVPGSVFSAPVALNNRILVATRNGRLHCYRWEGQVLEHAWSFPPETEAPLGPISADIAADSEEIVVVDETGAVLCLDWQSNVHWKHKLSGDQEIIARLSPILTAQYGYVLTQNGDSASFNRRTGAMSRWPAHRADGYFCASPALDAVNGRMYVPTASGRLLVLDAQAGAKVAAVSDPTLQGADNCTTPLILDQTVLFGLQSSGLLYACDKAHLGMTLWLRISGFEGPPVVSDGHLYIATKEGEIYAFKESPHE